VREAIHQAVARILVGADGSLTIEATPGGLLVVDELPLERASLDGDPMLDHTVTAINGRAWRLIAAPSRPLVDSARPGSRTQALTGARGRRSA
jgi:hypothetical protein